MQIPKSVIVINAAGSPIGKAIAIHFSSLGAVLALADTNKTRLKVTFDACQSINEHCEMYCLPKRSEEAIGQLFQQVTESLGTVSVLVNSWTGSDIPQLLAPTSVDNFSDTMSNSATSFFVFARTAAKHMLKQDSNSVIINVAMNQHSNQSHIPDANKAIVAGLTRSWAKELSMFDIRVGAVVPVSPRNQADNKTTILSIPMQEEIVRSIEYILSNDSFSGRMIEAEVIS